MLIVLYSAFAALSGVVEAVLYSRRGAEAFSRNEHVEMVAQRLAVLLLMPAGILTYQLCNEWAYVGGEMLAAVLCFPLVHDEAYNFTRLWISWREQCKPDNPEADYIAWEMAWREYRYGYQSASTTARNDFNGTERTLLALLGLVVEAAAFLLLYHG